ncbi:MAG: DUF1643 domain-containing protein [Bacteroidota bacterium]
MDYKPDIYLIDEKNKCRFALGQTGTHTLLAFGLNPSTADDQKPDQTISKLIGFAERNGYDGFVMLNLYPMRTPYPTALHKRVNNKLYKENLLKINEVICSIGECDCIAAWGGDIRIRKYLSRSLTDIVQLTHQHTLTWLKIGDLTKNGHPRHPSRAAYALPLTNLDIFGYLNKPISSK